MKNCPFCNLDPASPAATTKPRISLLRRTWQGLQWITPPTLLVLMPKCPMCIAAYIALFGGIGISVSTAHWIQIAMPVLCVTSLAYLTFKLWRSRSRRGSRMAAGNACMPVQSR